MHMISLNRLRSFQNSSVVFLFVFDLFEQSNDSCHVTVLLLQQLWYFNRNYSDAKHLGTSLFSEFN